MAAQRIGVLGAGKISRRNADALLKDYINGREVEIYLAEVNDDAARFAADFALAEGIKTTVYTSDANGDFADYADAAIEEREDAQESLLTVLRRAEDSALLFCFNEDDGEEAVLTAFLRAGVEVLDFAEGLYPVTLEDDGETTEETAPAAEPEPTPEPEAEAFEPEEEPLTEPDEAQQVTEAPKKRAPRKKPEPVADEENPHAKPEPEYEPTRAVAGCCPESPDQSRMLALEFAVRVPGVKSAAEVVEAARTLEEYLRAS